MNASSSTNVYDDARRAAAYATLALPGTYWLAYRDLPALITQHVQGRSALDFGCGAGRSTRYLKQLGFETVGIDISASMIEQARRTDPDGTYQLIADGDFGSLASGGFDLVLSSFAFDNIPDRRRRTGLVYGLSQLLRERGCIILVCSSPEIYVHEWTSFSTRDFPENRHARSGETVRIVMKDVPDQRPVVDFFWSDEDYRQMFADSGTELIACHRPLGRPDEPYPWQSELSVSPWVIYVLCRR